MNNPSNSYSKKLIHDACRPGRTWRSVLNPVHEPAGYQLFGHSDSVKITCIIRPCQAHSSAPVQNQLNTSSRLDSSLPGQEEPEPLPKHDCPDHGNLMNFNSPSESADCVGPEQHEDCVDSLETAEPGFTDNGCATPVFYDLVDDEQLKLHTIQSIQDKPAASWIRILGDPGDSDLSPGSQNQGFDPLQLNPGIKSSTFCRKSSLETEKTRQFPADSGRGEDKKGTELETDEWEKTAEKTLSKKDQRHRACRSGRCACRHVARDHRRHRRFQKQETGFRSGFFHAENQDFQHQDSASSKDLKNDIQRPRLPEQEEAQKQQEWQRRRKRFGIVEPASLNAVMNFHDLDYASGHPGFSNSNRDEKPSSRKTIRMKDTWQKYMRLVSSPWYGSIVTGLCLLFLASALAGNTYAWALNEQVEEEHQEYLLAQSRADLLASMNEILEKEMVSTEVQSLSANMTEPEVSGITQMDPSFAAYPNRIEAREVKIWADPTPLDTGSILEEQVVQVISGILSDNQENRLSMKAVVLDTFKSGDHREYLLQTANGKVLLAQAPVSMPFAKAGEDVEVSGVVYELVDYIGANGWLEKLPEIRIQTISFPEG